MGTLGFSKVYTKEVIPVFQKVLENAQGGFTLDMTNLTVDEIVRPGSLMIIDEATRKATLVRTARVHLAGTSTTTVQVEKGHNLVVGAEIDGVAVNTIDDSNADYDVLTMASAVDVVLGAILATADVTDLNTGLLYEETKAADNTTVSVVIRGTAYARRIPPVDKAQLPGGLILSKSK